jgi:hypothetical protein
MIPPSNLIDGTCVFCPSIASLFAGTAIFSSLLGELLIIEKTSGHNQRSPLALSMDQGIRVIKREGQCSSAQLLSHPIVLDWTVDYLGDESEQLATVSQQSSPTSTHVHRQAEWPLSLQQNWTVFFMVQVVAL